MAIERDAEGPIQQLRAHQIAQGLALGFHRRALRPAVPRQARAHALAADQPRNRFVRIERRVAHQVDPLRVGTGAAPHAARVDQRHEHEAQRFELALQHAVPGQALHEAAQVGQHDLGTDALQAVHAAKKTDGWQQRVGVAQGHGVKLELLPVASDVTDHAVLDP